jgi:hypothetical protein
MTRLSTRDSRAPSAPVNRSSPVTSAEWIDYFQRNARSLGAILWEAGVALTEAEQTAVAGSVPEWRRGGRSRLKGQKVCRSSVFNKHDK